MDKEELKTKLPQIGFSYKRNDEFNRDEYENEDYNGNCVKIYVDSITTRMELVFKGSLYRKNYRTYVELKQESNIANLINLFIADIKQFYHL